MRVGTSVCVCMRMRVCECARAWVRGCVRACVRACMCVCDTRTVTQSMSTCGERLMSGKAPFLSNLMRSLRAEVVPIAQQEPQSVMV